MTSRPTENTSETQEKSPADVAPRAATVNPVLSATLSADYEALQNDMQQAKDLAADFQRQLAGKSNEFAQLKQLFEKTTADLNHLQEGIVELRAERHRFANESMRATAFQAKLAQVTSERDRLRVDLEHVRKALTQSATEMASAIRDRDAQIAVLVVELVTLKDAMEVMRKEAAVARPVQVLRSAPAPEPDLESEFELKVPIPQTLPASPVAAESIPTSAPSAPSVTIDFSQEPKLAAEPRFAYPKRPVGEDMIDISFGR